jgi:hypothetical protein
LVAELNPVAAVGPVHQIAWDLQPSQDLAYPAYVIANLLRREVWLGPGSTRDVGNPEIPVGVIDEELKELELPLGQIGLSGLETNHSSLRIQPETLQLPHSPVPQLEAFLIALHLVLDELEIGCRCALRDRCQLRKIAPDPIEKPDLEPEQIRVDADPMASVFPV